MKKIFAALLMTLCLTVNILVEIDDVTVIVRDKLCYFRNDTRLIGTVQKHNCCGFHSFACFCLFKSLIFIYRVQSYDLVSEKPNFGAANTKKCLHFIC